MKQWPASGLTSHFPPAVPSNAKSVKFVAYPGFLQGGAYVQLRMNLPIEEVLAIDEKAKSMTSHIYPGGYFFDPANNAPETGWPTTHFHTSDAPNVIDLPTNFTLYVFSAKNYGAWNHGETYGVAVSTQTDKVIYWADAW